MDFRFIDHRNESRAGILIFLIFLLLSCSSVKGLKKNSGEAYMYGMVYNEENMPVSNAEVFIDGESTTVTDAQGRFILISRHRNDFTVTLNKAGYETVTGNFHFEPMEVIHMVMVNAIQLITQAEFAMEEGRYHEVISLCDRALALNLERIDASYLKALALIRLKQYEGARIILEELQKQTGEKEYIQQVLEVLPQ